MPTAIDKREQERAISDAIKESEKRYVDASLSPNTKRTYTAQWKKFLAWCEINERVPLPCSDETLAAYMTVLADSGRSAQTIAVAATAIIKAHEIAQERSPVVAKPLWQGIRRKLGTEPDASDPLIIEKLKTVIDALPVNGDNDLIALRDKALLLVGFAAGLRRSELVQLDVEDCTKTPRGLVLKIGGRDAAGTTRRTKTDQTGQGAVVGIPYAKNEALCAIKALDEWIARADIDSGAVFLAVDRWGNIKDRLLPDAVAVIVKRSVERALGRASDFSAHSLRSGMATSAAMAGKSVHEIKKQGRWASLASVDRYVRNTEALIGNALEGLL